VVAVVQMTAMRAPRSRSKGGARHRSHLSSAEHGNPVVVQREYLADRRTVREADTCGGNRTAKKQMAVAERQQEKIGAHDRALQVRSLPYNWPHTRSRAWARKGADVSRVAL
jgi:hypothetical protein